MFHWVSLFLAQSRAAKPAQQYANPRRGPQPSTQHRAQPDGLLPQRALHAPGL